MTVDIGKLAGRMIGPLPAGAWVVVVAGAIWWGRSSRSSAPATISSDENVEVGPGKIVSEVYPVVVDSPETNDDWQRRALTALMADGYDPTTADMALRDYVNGAALDVRARSMIDAALRLVGPLPTPLGYTENRLPENYGELVATGRGIAWGPSEVEGNTVPFEPQPIRQRLVPGPTGAMPPRGYYLTKRGDTLVGIGSLYGVAWRSIYEANKAKIPDQNNLAAGIQLTIPWA